MKKFFIKICKLLGYEILDQNNFSSPTLGKELNEELSILNEKSIILPLGEVKVTKKVKSLLKSHLRYTDSSLASFILDDIDNQFNNFTKVYPKELRAIHEKNKMKING